MARPFFQPLTLWQIHRTLTLAKRAARHSAVLACVEVLRLGMMHDQSIGGLLGMQLELLR
jgi:hypothetical protein